MLFFPQIPTQTDYKMHQIQFRLGFRPDPTAQEFTTLLMVPSWLGESFSGSDGKNREKKWKEKGGK